MISIPAPKLKIMGSTDHSFGGTYKRTLVVLDTRPIYHQRDDTIRGHVFCAFLALLVRQELQRRLAAKNWSLEWAHVVRDLDALHESTITIDGRAYVVRSEAKRTAGKVFQACGVALPPALRSLTATESPPETGDGRVTTRNPQP